MPLNAAPLDEHRVEDLEYGRSLYQYFQGDELGAITQLMIANERPEYRSRTQTDEANLLLADLYYGYGLYQESRDLFARLLSAEVSDSVQNRIWFNLARLRFEQGYFDQARDLLARISDTLPDFIESERKYLLTNLYLGNQQYDEASDLSNQIDSKSIWKIYARYNLAVTRIEDDSYELGKNLLDRIGQMDSTTPEMLALRDRANLSLGLKQLRLEYNESALESLSRIRLEGPLSHQALLATGWARYRLNQFDKALIPWRLLLQRNAVDAATQEAILAIPSGYIEAGQDQLALRHYEIAARQFDAQLQLLNDSIASIENNGLIAALSENAILLDRKSLQRLPPSSDVTPQLHILLASTSFQREIKRYQELLDIRDSLRYWGTSFPALELMLQQRRQGFEQRLPRLQQSTSFEQLELVREQRDQFAKRFAEIDALNDHTAFATPTEQEHIDRLQRINNSIDKVGGQRNTSYQQDMARLLSGLLQYQLATDYPQRRWKAKKQLIHLDRALAESSYRVDSLRRIAERTELNFDF
ncbi:MAG: hypothetical protein GY802_13815, partial [Gammaproteobacteria bacterium]|nr:hypothetical protein [Gammaproteobacteria bacterium]